MSDHPNDTVTVLVTLDMAALCRAARLGGMPIALDEQPVDESDASVELLRLFARRGILTAIDDSFDRHYPLRYPEDVDPDFWQAGGTATGRFWPAWRGKATW